MSDRPPPSRYRIVERGGRLQVIDSATGKTPPTAAERMAEHDDARGFANERRDQLADADAAAGNPAAGAAGKLPPAAAPKPPGAPRASAPPENPWGNRRPAPSAPATETAFTAAANQTRPADMPSRPPPMDTQRRAGPGQTGARPEQLGPRPAGSAQSDLVTTAKWWDANGPRTVRLSPAGRQKITNQLIPVVVVLLVAIGTISALTSPLVVLVGAVAAFRLFGNFFAGFGARLIDAAIQER